MAVLNQIIPIITLNVKDLKPSEKAEINGLDKKARPSYMLPLRNIDGKPCYFLCEHRLEILINDI